ncbi:MAG TPA: DMT family transporter [Actinomycetota bacterium]
MAKRQGFLFIAICTLAWGSIGVIVKEVTLNAPVIAFFRLAFGMSVVIAWLAWRRRLGELRPHTRPALLLASGAVLGAHWVTLFEAFKRLDVASTILIVFLGPVLMAAAAPLVLGERLRPLSIAALTVAFGGISLIAVPDIARIDTWGVIAALISGVLFAVMLLIGKLLAPKYTPSAMVVWQQGVAAVLVSPALLVAEAGEVVRALPLLVLLGMGYTGLLGILLWRAIGMLEAQQLSVMFYIEPASAVLYAWALLGEQPSWLTLVGGALVVAAGLAIIVGERLPGGTPSMPEPILEEA